MLYCFQNDDELHNESDEMLNLNFICLWQGATFNSWLCVRTKKQRNTSKLYKVCTLYTYISTYYIFKEHLWAYLVKMSTGGK